MYTEKECEGLMSRIGEACNGLLQFWHTSMNPIEHVKNISGSELPKDTHHTVLDLGCSNGQFLHYYSMLYPHAECVGINLFETQISLCTNPDLELMQGDIKTESLAGLSPDRVFCHYTLGHVEDYIDVIFHQVNAILPTGGEFVIWDAAQKSVNVNRIYDYRLFSPAYIYRKLEDAGFTVDMKVYETTNVDGAFLHPELNGLLDFSEVLRLNKVTLPVRYIARKTHGHQV